MEIDINAVERIAREAGEVILTVYDRDFTVEEKEDRSPVTEADNLANEVILESLKANWPDIPFISEETKATPFEERKGWKRFWLIDPLDGTKEFIKKNGEFTVNIALVEEGVPVAGVVYQPANGISFIAEKGQGAWKLEMNGSVARLEQGEHYSKKKKVKVVASRSHMTPEVEEFVEELRSRDKEVELISKGSSLKLCLVAEGKADVYPRFGPTMEWDTGAAHAVALEAGRKVLNRETGQPLEYNKENLLNPWFIVE